MRLMFAIQGFRKKVLWLERKKENFMLSNSGVPRSVKVEN